MFNKWIKKYEMQVLVAIIILNIPATIFITNAVFFTYGMLGFLVFVPLALILLLFK